jgi:hypothetical protein
MKHGLGVREGANQASAPPTDFLEKSKLKKWTEVYQIIPTIKIILKMYSIVNAFAQLVKLVTKFPSYPPAPLGKLAATFWLKSWRRPCSITSMLAICGSTQTRPRK